MLSKYEQTTAIWSWEGQVCFYESGQKQRIPFSVLSGRKLRSKNFSWKLLLGFSYRYKNDLICDGTQVNGSMRCKGEATDLGTLIWKPRGILFYNKLSTGWTRLSTLVHPKAISNGFKWLPVACLWKCPWFLPVEMPLDQQCLRLHLLWGDFVRTDVLCWGWVEAYYFMPAVCGMGYIFKIADSCNFVFNFQCSSQKWLSFTFGSPAFVRQFIFKKINILK